MKRRSRAISDLLSVGYPAMLLLLVAFVLGGGGSHSPLKNLVVQIVALALCCWFANRSPRLSERLGKPAVALLIMTFAVPLAQLLPLPPGLWQALPGRDLALDPRTLVDAGDEWFPLSMDRARTAGALAALIVPLGLILAVDLDRSQKRRGLMLAVVVLGVANFVTGGLQVLIGNTSILGYPSLVPGRLYGFFANHNSSGLFFVMSLCALAASVSREDLKRRKWVIVTVAAMLVLGVILTQSRSSLGVLAVIGLIFAWKGVVGTSWAERKPRHRKAAVGLVVGAVAAGLLLTNSRIGDTFARFGTLEDSRPAIWADTVFAIDRYWPVGSGMGTFDEVFQVDESLETLLAPEAGRAHNDYLEVTLEAGIFGLLLVVAWLVWLVLNWSRARQLGLRTDADFVAAGLLCIALQSGIDYPLRNLAMLCLAACFAAVLATPKSGIRDPNLD